MSFEEKDGILEESEGIPGYLKLLALGLLTLIVVFVVVVTNSFRPRNYRLEKLNQLWHEREPGPEDDHDTLLLVEEALPRKVKMHPLNQLPPGDGARRVLGVSHGEHSQAVVVRPVRQKRHVLLVETQLGDKPVSILFNYNDNFARAFTHESSEPLGLMFGGGEFTRRVVVFFKGARYVQDSKEIPFDDFPVELTSLEAWTDEHPNTLINFDEELNDQDYFTADRLALQFREIGPDDLLPPAD